MRSRPLSIVNPIAAELQYRHPRPCILLGGRNLPSCHTFETDVRVRWSNRVGWRKEGAEPGAELGRNCSAENEAATSSGATAVTRT